MGWWRVKDVSFWPKKEGQTVGKRAKSWIEQPGTEIAFLRKEPLAWAPSETPIELLAFEIVRQLGLATPTTYAAIWNTPQGEEKGIISQNFLEKEHSIALGVQLLEVEEEYAQACYREKNRMHSLPRVRRILTNLALKHGQEPDSLLFSFACMLYADYAMGLGDRHHENWSVITDDNVQVFLSPIYDLDSCLGAKLKSDHKLFKKKNSTLTQFVDKCPSAFGDEHCMLSMNSLLEVSKRWPEWHAVCSKLDPLLKLLNFKMLIADIPQDWLSPSRANLALDLLELRRECLLKP